MNQTQPQPRPQSIIIEFVPGTNNLLHPVTLETPIMYNVPLNSSAQSASSDYSELSAQSASSAESELSNVSFETVRQDIINATDSDDNDSDNDTVWSLDFNAVNVDDNDDNDTLLSLDCNMVDESANDNNDYDNVHNTVFDLGIAAVNPSNPSNPSIATTTPTTIFTAIANPIMNTDTAITDNQMDIDS